MIQKIRKAVFPVGGLGTRFLPATKSMPKEMLPVLDKPLIQYVVEEAIASGIEELIFVTGRGKTVIEDHFDRSFELEETLRVRSLKFDHTKLDVPRLSPGNITYIREQEPLGLGHAVWCARHLIREEPFAVLLADDFIYSQEPCLKQMMDIYQGGILTAVTNVERDQVNRYGIVDIESTQQNLIKVKGVVEKPLPHQAPSQTAIIGRYILDAHIFDFLESQSRGANDEIQLTDAIAKFMERTPFYALHFKGERYDCGTKRGLLLASIYMALQQQAKIGEITNEIENLLVDHQKNFYRDNK